MKQIIKRLSQKNENGFSLLELVVSIGILLVLTVGGLIGYGAITTNAKKAAVENAAATVIKMIAIKESSVSSNVSSNGSFEVQNINTVSNDYVYNEPQDAADEWMRTAGSKNKIDITAGVDSSILTVEAVYDNDEKISAKRTADITKISNGNSGDSTIPDEDNNEIVPENELISLDPGTCHPVLFAYLEAEYENKKYHSLPNNRLLAALKEQGKITESQLEEFNNNAKTSQEKGEILNSAQRAAEDNNDAFNDLVNRSSRIQSGEGEKVYNKLNSLGQPYQDETKKINSENKFENPDKVNEMYVELINTQAEYVNIICK